MHCKQFFYCWINIYNVQNGMTLFCIVGIFTISQKTYFDIKCQRSEVCGPVREMFFFYKSRILKNLRQYSK